MQDQDSYQRAKKRVEEKVGFYIHLSIYIVVSTLLIIINLSTSTQYYWFKWPIIGWGVGVLFHGLGIYVFSEGSVITKKMIEKEMQKDIYKK